MTKVCEICGVVEGEEEAEEASDTMSRSILHVCELCRSNWAPRTEE